MGSDLHGRIAAPSATKRAARDRQSCIIGFNLEEIFNLAEEPPEGRTGTRMSTTTDTSAAATETPTLFTRKATGLVREGRTRDALFYNVMWSSVALTFAFYWLFLGSYRGSSAILGVLFAAALGLPGAFLYAMLTQVMPRSGGDYVFNSRILHPSIGFAANFSYCVWVIVSSGIYTTYIANYGFGAFARTMAGFTGATRLAELRRMVLDPLGPVHHRHRRCCCSPPRCSWSAARACSSACRSGASRSTCSARSLLPVLVGLLQSRRGFIHNFNAYAANLGTPHASTALAASAAEGGLQRRRSSASKPRSARSRCSGSSSASSTRAPTSPARSACASART